MSTITEYYKIRSTVPFVDVDVDLDTRLFLDPHAIRLLGAPEPFVTDANRATKSFFDLIATCVMSADADDRDRGLDLLQHFVEPWETRLGMAARGHRGHGAASDIGRAIWEALSTELDALVRIGILTQIEDLPLFVERVDRDITSDLTTRIAFAALGRFTERVCEEYDEFSGGLHEVREVERQVWDGVHGCWSVGTFKLPIAEGDPLLLVPKGWARPSLLMSSARYFDLSILDYIQQEKAVRLPDGTVAKSPKRALRKQSDSRPGRGTNLSTTRRAFDAGDDLLMLFKRYVDRKYRHGLEAA